MDKKNNNFHTKRSNLARDNLKRTLQLELLSALSLFHAGKDNYEGTAFRKIDWSMICLN